MTQEKRTVKMIISIDVETWSQMLPNKPIDDEYCSCEYPTLGSSISRCGTCQKWFKRVS